MDKVTYIDVESFDGTETHAIIERGDGSFISMPKAVYEAQVEQANKPAIDVVQ